MLVLVPSIQSGARRRVSLWIVGTGLTMTMVCPATAFAISAKFEWQAVAVVLQ